MFCVDLTNTNSMTFDDESDYKNDDSNNNNDDDITKCDLNEMFLLLYFCLLRRNTGARLRFNTYSPIH